jgi:hypothetical protein
MTESDDVRERALAAMIDVARLEPPPVMSEAEAALVLARVLVEMRRPSRRRAWTAAVPWLAGLGAAAAVLAALVSSHRPPEGAAIARETVIHAEADGREVYIRAVAYKAED